jgi:hypothetical protein
MSILDGEGEYVPGHRPIDNTDLEISYNMMGPDLVLRVNKAGVLVLRVLLEKAAVELTSEQLFSFSTVVPDFIFKIGDTADGVRRLARSLGLEVPQMIPLEEETSDGSVEFSKGSQVWVRSAVRRWRRGTGDECCRV